MFEIGRVFKNSNQKIIEQDKLAGIFQFNNIEKETVAVSIIDSDSLDGVKKILNKLIKDKQENTPV